MTSDGVARAQNDDDNNRHSEVPCMSTWSTGAPFSACLRTAAVHNRGAIAHMMARLEHARHGIIVWACPKRPLAQLGSEGWASPGSVDTVRRGGTVKTDM